MAYHLGLLLNTHAALAASFSGLKAQHIGAEALSLSELEANLSIGVQAERQGSLRGHRLINILQHLPSCKGSFSMHHSTADMLTRQGMATEVGRFCNAIGKACARQRGSATATEARPQPNTENLLLPTYLLVSHGISRCEEGWEHFHAFQQSLIEVLEEVSIGKASVPVLYNVTSVHDLSKNVSQVIPRNLQVIDHAVTPHPWINSGNKGLLSSHKACGERELIQCLSRMARAAGSKACHHSNMMQILLYTP